LEDEAAVLGDDAGAEATIGAVYEGAAVALGVGDGEVDCVCGLEGGGAVVEGGVHFCWVEEGGAGGEVGLLGVSGELGGEGGGGWNFVEETGDGDGIEGGVGHPPVAVGEGDSEGFDHGVEVSV